MFPKFLYPWTDVSFLFFFFLFLTNLCIATDRAVNKKTKRKNVNSLPPRPRKRTIWEAATLSISRPVSRVGKLGPVSLSLSYSLSKKPLSRVLLSLANVVFFFFFNFFNVHFFLSFFFNKKYRSYRRGGFYLAPQICAGTANTLSPRIHRTRPRSRP